MKWILALVLGLIIFQSRLTGGAWLTGWDNLHPEFNYSLNLTRALTGVWQEYQGLGLPGGMAHVADLPRILILWLIDIFLPSNLVRWVWHIGMLSLGTIGVWRLGKKIGKWGELACLTASLFYLFNLVTIQYFFVPYESFSSFYGFLPWLISSYLSYLESGKKNDLGKVLIIGILATPAFYVQTFFVVYVIILAIFTLGYLKAWKRIVKAGLVILAVNAFWLLPLVVSVVSGGRLVGDAKINSIGSPETVYMNSGYGGVGEVTSLKSFFLDWVEWNGGDKWGRMMQTWWEWSDKQTAMIAGWVLFGLGMLGVLWGVVKRHVKWGWLAGLVVVYMMIASYQAPFGVIYNFLANNVPLFGEMFRSAFTKWGAVLALFLVWGAGSLVENVRKIWIKRMIAVIVIGASVFIALPTFKNGLIWKQVKMEMPGVYRELNLLMANLEQGRVVYLPAHNFWSWKYHDWGYRGSGFLWYGIEQPILDRAFDVWSPYNETFYNQLSTTLYGDNGQCDSDKVTQCHEAVQKVLQKYDVRYVLLDESVIAPGQGKEILRIEETKELAEELGWKQVFQEGFLTVWDTGINSGNKFVSAPGSYSLAEGDVVKTRKDVIFEELGNYVTSDAVTQMQYPFAQLFREEVKNIEYGERRATLVTQLNSDAATQITVPGFKTGEQIEAVYTTSLREGKLSINWEPMYLINGQDGPRLTNREWDVENKYLWVQVGENTPVFIEEGKEVRRQARLKVGEAIEITIYDGVVAREEQPRGWTKEWEQKCGENKELSCYAMKLEEAKYDQLMQVIVPFEGKGLEVCLDREGEPYECVNREIRGTSPMVQLLPVKKGEVYWLDYVLKEEEISLAQPIVRYYPKLETITIENGWEDWNQEKVYALQGVTLKVEVAGIPKKFDMSELGQVNPANCDVLERGRARKTVTSDTVTQYVADERGAVCDYMSLAGLTAELPYLMRMTGENIEGRSIKFFLYNDGSKRNDLEYLLDEGQFDQTFSLLPWAFEAGYVLNTETRSFGQSAENRLTPVEVRYFPLEQIVGARIGEIGRVENKLEVENVKKTGTWLYRVETEGEGLVKLSQGYDEGWMAYQGKKKLEHVKVNGWANGWLVDKEGELIIFYWPQLLEYVGFALLGMTMLAIWKCQK